jgi:hypothetical protein
VDGVIETFSDYWFDSRFEAKKPTYTGTVREKCGDNIYEPLASGGYRQLRSTHSDGDVENEENKAHDLSGKRVLVSETFTYFGSKAELLPPELQRLVVTRGHRCNFSDEVKDEFIRFAGRIGFSILPRGVPRQWPQGDDSWMEGGGKSRKKT